MPRDSATIGLYDPSTNTFTRGPGAGSDGAKFVGGVLLPDGRVLLVPWGADHVGLYDPSADAWTEGKDDLSAVGNKYGYKYDGGVLLPDGRVVLVPAKANHVGLYDAGGTRNGAAYTVATLSPATNALLLPYYNKL